MTQEFHLLFQFAHAKLSAMASQKRIRLNKDQIEALRQGDLELLHEIFVELQPRIHRFVWLRSRSEQLAEDVVQETFLRFWDSRTKLKTGTNIETFLFRIASNLTTDQLRKNERHNELNLENACAVTASASTDEIAEYNQLVEIIDSIISSLPDAPRTAFTLSRYEALQHKEIAEVMGISIKTVEKHISKALQTLRDELQQFDIVLPS